MADGQKKGKRVHLSGNDLLALGLQPDYKAIKKGEAAFELAALVPVLRKNEPNFKEQFIDTIKDKLRKDFGIPPQITPIISLTVREENPKPRYEYDNPKKGVYGGWPIAPEMRRKYECTCCSPKKMEKYIRIKSEDDPPPNCPKGKEPMKAKADVPHEMKGRRIDFYFGCFPDEKNLDPWTQKWIFPNSGKEWPVVYRLLEQQDKVGNRRDGPLREFTEVVATQLKNLRTTKWGVDPALTLVITQRESTNAAFGTKDKTFDSLNQGGLDLLYKEQKILRKEGFLPPTVPDLVAAPPAESERGKKATPAEVPCKVGVECYGAVLNYRRKRFIDNAIAIMGLGFTPFDLTDPKTYPWIEVGTLLKEINDLSIRALRIWNIIFFGGEGWGTTILSKFKQSNTKLEKIVGHPLAQQFHAGQRGLVNAAEAELLEEKIGLPPPTRWEVSLKYKPLPPKRRGKK